METKQYPDMECDVVIAGCGVAGLYAALNLPTSTRVIMLSKGAVDECDSMLAQGGICVLPEGSDYDAFFEDTMHAGHYENRRESVDIMIRSSRSVINDLLAMGVDFERRADGSLDFTREGAHSRPRIAFHADITGKEITTKLLQAVRKLDNVQILGARGHDRHPNGRARWRHGVHRRRRRSRGRGRLGSPRRRAGKCR